MAYKWLDDIRESQSDFGLKEPEGLWEGIEAGLAAGDVPSAGEKRRRRILPWALAGALSACAAALALFLLLPGHGGNLSPVPVEDGIALSDSGPADRGLSSLISDASPLTSVSGDKTSGVGTLPFAATLDIENEDVAQHPDENAAEVPEKSAPETEQPAEESAVESPAAYVKPSTAAHEFPDTPFDAPEDRPRRHEEKKLRLGVAFSNVTGNTSSSAEYAALYGSGVTRQIHSFSETEGEFPDSRGYVSVLQSNEGGDVSSKVRNWQPIQVGVTLAYPFTDRLSLETGLTYSCLISDLSSGADNGKYQIRQSLHYLGIPLNLRYDFLKIKDFRMYSSLGGQMEKCVAGKTVTDYFAFGEKISSDKGKIMVEPLQWSVNAHIGAQYGFTGWAGIYIEAGAEYYFRNGSPVNCIYSERPLNFSLRAGFRFSL